MIDYLLDESILDILDKLKLNISLMLDSSNKEDMFMLLYIA